jgi:hypothetical protein
MILESLVKGIKYFVKKISPSTRDRSGKLYLVVDRPKCAGQTWSG